MNVEHQDAEAVRNTRNIARFFVEHAHISWVLLFAVLAWGTLSYLSMPQRKDPEIPVREAVAIVPWPGATSHDVEELVTRKIEDVIAENSTVAEIRSVSRSNVAVVYVKIGEDVADTAKQFDDINLRLDTVRDLPPGAGPIKFIKDFGDTAALMLSVASPKADEIEIDLRARAIRSAVERVRDSAELTGSDARVTLLYLFAQSVSHEALVSRLHLAADFLAAQEPIRDVRPLEGTGFIGWDLATTLDDQALLGMAQRFVKSRLRASEFHPDSWGIVVVRDPAQTAPQLAALAGDKYSYRELDTYTDLLSKTFLALPIVSKVTRSGVWEERVYLEYSQERLASYGLVPSTLQDILGARNITLPGGLVEVDGKNITVDPSGEFENENQIKDVLITKSSTDTPVYIRDLGAIVRGYENPPRFLNYYRWKDADGTWQRSRAITLAVQMRSRQQIAEFGDAVEEAMRGVQQRLPEDLILARTSDQPRQVSESISQFMGSLYVAIGLVVLVALVGFWQWRSTLIIAISIPLSVALTFGLARLLGIDLQQVSIAALIIALGLLVDDPIVATDAIRNNLSLGHAPGVAGWLGPTKLSKAMYFSTVTNIVAYLPFLLFSGDKGRFLYSLPVVLAITLVASRLVAMTYVPFLGSILLKRSSEPGMSTEEKRRTGLSGMYCGFGRVALEHRKKVLAGSLLILLAGALIATRLPLTFFPKDFSYLSYVNLWLPEDAPLSETQHAAQLAEEIIQRTVHEYEEQHSGAGEGDGLLASLTTFVGGGSPRFWFSVAPELLQLNYAQIIVRVNDNRVTRYLVDPLQHALEAEIPGARVDVRELETGEPVGVPVEVRLMGDDVPTLRALAEQVKGIFRELPQATRIRDDWGAESFSVKLSIDSDRANLAGVSNLDVAISSLYGTNGLPVTTLREGNKRIPVVARLRMEERSQLADIQNLYVYSTQGPQKVPLGQISSIDYQLQTERVWRRNQFRTITVGCFPAPGMFPSQVTNAASARLREFEAQLPPGYRMEIGGEQEKRDPAYREVAVIMAISAVAIYLALLLQFQHAVKPLVLIAAIPYGMVGGLAVLWGWGSSIGFMALLGLASLIGLITAQAIVLFDSVEEMQARGAPLFDGLLDSCITRTRPVMISVGSTVLGLLPLALKGGPLWEPLTYAQIGGLTVSVVITLFVIPVLYAFVVLDLKLVRWE